MAGAIGIEPTPWESEAHVLPLHQAPSRELLYNKILHLANDLQIIDFKLQKPQNNAVFLFGILKVVFAMVFSFW